MTTDGTEPALLPFYPQDFGPVGEWSAPRIRLPYTSRWGFDYRETFDTKAEAVAAGPRRR